MTLNYRFIPLHEAPWVRTVANGLDGLEVRQDDLYEAIYLIRDGQVIDAFRRPGAEERMEAQDAVDDAEAILYQAEHPEEFEDD